MAFLCSGCASLSLTQSNFIRYEGRIQPIKCTSFLVLEGANRLRDMDNLLEYGKMATNAAKIGQRGNYVLFVS